MSFKCLAISAFNLICHTRTFSEVLEQCRAITILQKF